MRKNGLQRPYNIMQIATWIILPTLIAEFFLFVSPILPLGASIPVSVVFFFFGCLSAYRAYECCITDPIDDMLDRHLHGEDLHCPTADGSASEGGNDASPPGGKKRGRGGAATGKLDGALLLGRRRRSPPRRTESGPPTPKAKRPRFLGRLRRTKSDGLAEEEDRSAAADDDETKYCWVCQTSVRAKSMHCKFCDKCVSDFDHHCQWLNTCVGSANYVYFFDTVVHTFLFVFVHMGGAMGVVVSYFVQNAKDGGGTVDRARDWLGADAPMANVGVNIAFLVFDVVALGLIGQLLYFHFGLRREGITTYEYIVRDNAKKRDKSREAMVMKNRRTVEIGKAKKDGRKVFQCRLALGGLPGGVCRPCDPLPAMMRREKKAKKAAEENAEGNAGRGGDESDDDESEEDEGNATRGYRPHLDGSATAASASASSLEGPTAEGSTTAAGATAAEAMGNSSYQDAENGRSYRVDKSDSAGSVEMIRVGTGDGAGKSALSSSSSNHVPTPSAEDEKDEKGPPPPFVADNNLSPTMEMTDDEERGPATGGGGSSLPLALPPEGADKDTPKPNGLGNGVAVV